MSDAVTFLDALALALSQAGQYNKNDQAPPTVILWPDKEQAWEALLPRLRTARPVWTFDPQGYAPAEQRGPAYYLRCLLAGSLPVPALPAGQVPVIYLPGVSKAELRAVEDCPRALQPLAELQYRGVLWTQKNGKDWTIAAFLQSKDGGQGIEVGGDAATREALRQALGRLADIPLGELRKHAPLKEGYLLGLLNPDEGRSLLRWLNDPLGYPKQVPAEEWAAFCAQCVKKYGFHPEKDGAISAAQKLGEQAGPWKLVWERYLEAPQAYPNIPDKLRSGRPAQLALFERAEAWPQDNKNEEAALGQDLLVLQELSFEQARARVLELEQRHGPRREWVWARLGAAPLAQALGHLAQAVAVMQTLVLAGSVAERVQQYAGQGWQVDAAMLRALRAAEQAAAAGGNQRAAVRGAVQAVYRPWLEKEADAFRQAVLAQSAAPGGLAGWGQPLALPEPGECVLFSDGLRMDLAQELRSRLSGKGYACTLEPHLAALPPLTATAKPALLLGGGQVSGVGKTDLNPHLPGKLSALMAEALRKRLAELGVQTLKEDETGDPGRSGWTELGDIDAYGHEHSSKLPLHALDELAALEKRVAALLAAGWRQVRVVSDHGWLLLPGGLPKVELAEHLAQVRKGRCARLKDGAKVDLACLPWHWDLEVWVAYPPGIACFEAGKEYEHGGLSLQECITAVLCVSQAAAADAAAVEITGIKWTKQRCTLKTTGAAPGMLVDIRSKAGDPGSSLLAVPRPLDAHGAAALVVEDAERAGEAAFVVVLGPGGQPAAQRLTTIGG